MECSRTQAFVARSNPPFNFLSTYLLSGPSWSWSYASWIYNYLCNQYLSPLMLWVRFPLRQHNIIW